MASLACEYHTTARHWCAQNADHFGENGLAWSGFVDRVFCTRWSEFWVPRPSDRPLDGGNCTTRGYDTPATHRLRASCSAKHPLLPVWRAAEALEGLAAVPVGGGGAWSRQISHAIPPRHGSMHTQKPQNIND